VAETSNIHEIVTWLDDFIKSFSFTRVGRDQSLGRDLAMTIIRGPEASVQGGIMGRCAEDQGPDGSTWPENSDQPPGKYRSRKQAKYGHAEPNRRTGQMLSQTSLYGRTTIEPEQVTLRYGTDATPAGSAAPSGTISDADKAVTDTQKASWAHSGQSQQQVVRAFYAATEEDARNVSACAQTNLNQYIRESSGYRLSGK
jgi:hypothetical protein